MLNKNLVILSFARLILSADLLFVFFLFCLETISYICILFGLNFKKIISQFSHVHIIRKLKSNVARIIFYWKRHLNSDISLKISSNIHNLPSCVVEVKELTRQAVSKNSGTTNGSSSPAPATPPTNHVSLTDNVTGSSPQNSPKPATPTQVSRVEERMRGG